MLDHPIRQYDLQTFSDDPFSMSRLTCDEIFSFTPAALEQIQLGGLRKRFAELTPFLPPLKALAEENRITHIADINAIVPLLFPHTVYKSYPISLIDNCRFAQLNSWLNDYTTHDLSGLDVSACQSLDEWLSLMEEKTPVRVMTSSGTSGRISLLPRSLVEEKQIPAVFSAVYGKFRDEPGLDNIYAPNVYHVSPFAKFGRHISGHVNRAQIEYGYAKGIGESHIMTLGGAISTDLLWMTGRMKKAQADGTVEQLKKTKAWQRLSGKMAVLDANKAASLDAFYQDMLVRLRDKTVLMRFGLTYYLALVECAEKHGLEIRFAPNSVTFLVGGLKGAAPLSDAQMAKIRQAIPFELNEIFACSELMSGLARKCRHGHYHAPPWLVGFVLDPDTGVPYPRHGLQTGRYAGFDLWAETYWGGFITGDEVTINFDGGCACGRTGPYMHGTVTRYSDKRGGDDKITCQRTAAAVDEMMEHMKSSALTGRN